MYAGKAAGPAELVKADLSPAIMLGITRAGSLYYSISGSQRRNVMIAELDSSMQAVKEPALATEKFVNSTFGAAWSPDGEWLAYYAAAGPGTTKLYVRSVKTGHEREIPLEIPVMSSFNDGPKWSRDARSIFVQSGRRELREQRIYRVDLQTGKAELLHSVGQPGFSSWAVSPDGKSIFYCQQQDGSGEKRSSGRLIRYDVGSADPVVLKKDRWFISIALSPDGSQVAFLESIRSGDGWPSSISVMPASGGEAREVYSSLNWLDGSRYNTLSWSPDQHYLIFAKGAPEYNEPNVVWRVPVRGGSAEKMGISMLARMKSPSIHPGGRFLVFSTQETDSGEIWAMESFLPSLSAKK